MLRGILLRDLEIKIAVTRCRGHESLPPSLLLGPIPLAPWFLRRWDARPQLAALQVLDKVSAQEWH